jgi:hypothetical protein
MGELTITLRGLSRRQVVLIAGSATMSVALAIGAIVYIRHFTSLTGLPQNSYKNLSFPVYFPRHAPNGFRFDTNSVSSKPDVLAYKYVYQGQKPVYVSIQPKDPQLDPNSFNPTRTITTTIGNGYLADFDTRTTVAVVADKSMILINSPLQIPDQLVEQFADSLAPVK